jgi:hypothetical protein
MLPTFWATQYQILLEHLQDFQNLLDSSEIKPQILENCFKQLKDHFYTQIIPLKLDDIPLDAMSKCQSLQTELHRTLRLLETDLLFWGSARQSATRQARLQVIRDRTSTMIRFCQEMLSIIYP